MKQIRNKIWKSLLLLIVAMLPLSVSGQRSRSQQSVDEYENTQLFVVESVSEMPKYVGQIVNYSVKLYSTNPGIEYARAVTETRLEGFTRIPVTKSSFFGSGISRETYKGKPYYTVVLDEQLLVADTPGNCMIKGAEYIIGVNEYQLYRDPFWGQIRRLQPSEYPVKAKDMKMKVRSLPKAPAGFSGAIGEYTVKAVLPEGPISPDGEADILFYISGTGDLRTLETPDVTAAFGSDVELNNVQKNSRTWAQDGDVKSELTIECEFIPLKEGELTIAPFSFTFFNPAKGKYVTVKTDPVKFTSKRPDLPSAPKVIHDI